MRFFVALAAMYAPIVAFAAESLSADNFGQRFEASPMAKSMRANAYKGDCRDGYGRTCSYSVRTTTIDVQSREDGKGLRSVTINCSACEGAHMLFVLPMVLKMVLPATPPKTLRACFDASMRAMDNSSTETIDLGPAQFIASRKGKELTTTVAFRD